MQSNRHFLRLSSLTLTVALLAVLGQPRTATAQYLVHHLSRPINTQGSETGALKVGDTVLVYSSMQPSEGRNSQFHFDNTQMQVMQARISKDGRLAKPRLSRWGLNAKGSHTGNLALDPVSHDLYFTRAAVGDPDLRSEIWWAKRGKRGWGKPQRLGGEVNLKSCTSTQPAVARLADGTTILYFASDRPGGLGGMDLWYCIVKGGTASEPVNLGPRVNSDANEITPFFDQPNGVLYFSSDRAGGRGGYDIYCAVGQRNTWQAAEPVCSCLNSGQNDIYFTITDRDSASGFPLAGYMASNRRDSYFWSDSMCCNDIYQWSIDSSALVPVAQAEPEPPRPEPVAALPEGRFMFPLFLYFHNDDPDPKSRSSETGASYAECQGRYLALRADYVARQRTGEDSALMQQFFDSCVVGNYRRVEELFGYLEAQLAAGRQVTLTVSGYASPLFKSAYNQAISHRRIVSFINLIRQWHGGVFDKAIRAGDFTVLQQPHGEVEPTTKSRNADPVYGLPAALARRIEIRSCDVR